MILNHKLVLLWCLIVGFVHNVPTQAVSPTYTPTKSPECPGMKKAAASLQKGIALFTQETIKCQVNNLCTGLSCNGTHKSNPFYMKIVLKHCIKKAPEIHLDLKYPAKNLDVHKELKQGSKIKLYSTKQGLLPIDSYLKLTLTRDKNHITSSIVVETCVAVAGAMCRTVFTLLPRTTFCVNMNACKGFNTTGYPPCNPGTPTPAPKSTPTMSSLATTTGSIKTPTTFPGHSSPTEIKTKLPSTKTTGPFKTTEHSTRIPVSSKPKSHTTHSTPEHLKTTPFSEKFHGTTQNPEPMGKKEHRHDDGHHHIGVGLAVGIGFACIAVIGIIIGVIIYWKKFHHRSRLRAAYYNDISMNDPLYEDFGPEVA